MAPEEREFPHKAETVLLTGATGNVGSWVVDRLADQGVEVVGVDLDLPSGSRANVEFHDVDLRDPTPTGELVAETDPDAVVHLAAISDPLGVDGAVLFDNNVTSTYNVLDAAGRAGIDVVWTSSQAVYGALFAAGPWVPEYLPIDEAHPLSPEDPYGTSKRCGEQVAEMVARRDGIAVTTIRPATVFTPEKRPVQPLRDRMDLRSDEHSGDFGSYVDVRDLARLVEAALAGDYGGHEVVLCVADENYLGEPTAELVEAICGRLPVDCSLEGREAAFSNAKARQLLGWSPVHTIPEHETVAGPSWL